MIMPIVAIPEVHAVAGRYDPAVDDVNALSFAPNGINTVAFSVISFLNIIVDKEDPDAAQSGIVAV